MNKINRFPLRFLFAGFVFGIAGCSLDFTPSSIDADIANLFSTIGTDRVSGAFAEFDAKYDTDLTSRLAAASTLASGGSNYPELADIPFDVDGAVYLSGGGDSAVARAVDLISPKNLPGGFFHGAVLDIDKFDPNNLSAASLQTSTAKGADYESAADWRKLVNVVVLYPKVPLEKSRLDEAQKAVNYYCQLPWDKQNYGFFKNYVNVFDVVTKEDKHTWYCTKVVWEVYKNYGIDIDSNDERIDFGKSGLYALVAAYYEAHHRGDPAAARAGVENYIADAKEKLVLAEEIYLSPYFEKAYERIRSE